jgi:hypothetical protein
VTTRTRGNASRARSGLAFLALGACLAGRSARADDVDACLSGADRGQALRRESHLVDAREQLRACARPQCPKVVRSDCQRWLGEVDAAIPSVAVRVTDASGVPASDARVTVDSKPLALDGRSLEVDPGEHAFHAEASGGRVADARATLKAGERDRPVVLALAPAAPPAPVGAAPQAAASAVPPGTSTAPQAPHDEVPAGAPSHPIPVASWILGGVGVAALGGAAVLWASGLGDRSGLYGGCGQTQSCAQSDVDASRTKLVIGDVSAAAGVVALGAAVWITVSNWRRASAPAAAVMVVPGGAMASWSGAF